MAGTFSSLLSSSAASIQASEIRKILELTRSGNAISFAGGLPCPKIFPAEDISQCAQHVLRSEGKTALQYGPTRGEPQLLQEIWKLMEADGGGPPAAGFSQANLMVTSGSQQGLDLVGKLLIDDGDAVVLGMPSYIGALQAFDSYGAQFHGVAVDEDGMCPDALESKLRSLQAQGVVPKLIYTVPDFQNPTGVCLTLERRQAIVELAARFGSIVMEDCPYRQVRFEGQHLPSLATLDAHHNTVSLHTFSKVMVPGLRLGWLMAHEELLDRLLLLKQATDLCTPSLNQLIAAEYCRRGLLEPHIRQVIDLYRLKRDRMLEALQRHMPPRDDIHWTTPGGGLFLWVTLPESVNAIQLLPAAIEAGVAFVVGDAFFPDRHGGANTLRLNFSYPEPDEVEQGVQRLAKIIANEL